MWRSYALQRPHALRRPHELRRPCPLWRPRKLCRNHEFRRLIRGVLELWAASEQQECYVLLIADALARPSGEGAPGLSAEHDHRHPRMPKASWLVDDCGREMRQCRARLVVHRSPRTRRESRCRCRRRHRAPRAMRRARRPTLWPALVGLLASGARQRRGQALNGHPCWKLSGKRSKHHLFYGWSADGRLQALASDGMSARTRIAFRGLRLLALRRAPQIAEANSRPPVPPGEECAGRIRPGGRWRLHASRVRGGRGRGAVPPLMRCFRRSRQFRRPCQRLRLRVQLRLHVRASSPARGRRPCIATAELLLSATGHRTKQFLCAACDLSRGRDRSVRCAPCGAGHGRPVLRLR